MSYNYYNSRNSHNNNYNRFSHSKLYHRIDQLALKNNNKMKHWSNGNKWSMLFNQVNKGQNLLWIKNHINLNTIELHQLFLNTRLIIKLINNQET